MAGAGGGALVTEVLARISADSTQFIRGMQGAAQAAQQFSSSVEQSTNTAQSALSRLGSAAANVTGVIAGALGAATIGFGINAFNAAARVGELDVAMQAVAKSTGKSYTKLKDATLAVKNNGIEMAIAQQSVMKFVQMNLDASKAADVSRVAQDLAVIAGENSTDTFNRLTQAIQTQNSESLRGVGIMKTSGEMFNDYAKTLGISAKQMTTAQKQQAILNGVLKEGGKVAGTYEAAMKEPGKVLRSFPRLVNDLAVAIGMPLKNAFGPLILNIYNAFKAFKSLFEAGGALEPLMLVLQAVFTAMVKPLTDLSEKAVEFFENIKPIKGNLGELADKISAAIPPLAALTAGFAAFTGANILSRLPLIGRAFAGIGGPLLVVAAVLGALAMTSPQMQSALLNLVSAFQPLLPIVKQLGGVLMTVLNAAVLILAAGINALANGIRTVTEWMAAHQEIVIGVIAVLGAAVAGYYAVILATKLWTAAQALLNTTMELNPIGLIVGAIAALVAAIVYAYNTSETFREVFTKVMNFIAKYVGMALSFVIGAFGKLLLAYGKILDTNTLLGKAIAFVFNFIWKVIATVVGTTISFYASLALAIVQLIETHKWLHNAIATVMKAIVLIVGGAIGLLLGTLSAFMQGLGNLIKFATDKLGGFADAVGYVVALLPGMDGIGNKIRDAARSVRSFGASTQAALKGASDSVNGLNAKLMAMVKNFDAGKALDSILAGVKKAAQVMKTIGGAINKAGDFKLGDFLVNTAGKVATSAGQFLVNLASTIRDFTDSGFTEKVAGAIGGLVDKLQDWLKQGQSASDIYKKLKEEADKAKDLGGGTDKPDSNKDEIDKAAKKIKDQADLMKAIRAAMAKGIEQIQGVINDLRKAAQDFAESLKNAVLSFAGIRGVDLPDNFVPQFESLLENMRTRLQKTLEFNKMVADLQAAGLNKDTMKDILDMGVLKGSQYAQSILSGGAGAITEMNAMQEMIAGAGSLLGAFGANAIYADDIAAAQKKLEAITDGSLDARQAGNNVYVQEGAFQVKIDVSEATNADEVIAVVEAELDRKFKELAAAIAAGK